MSAPLPDLSGRSGCPGFNVPLLATERARPDEDAAGRQIHPGDAVRVAFPRGPGPFRRSPDLGVQGSLTLLGV